jgi:hypothetical protein
MLKKYHTLLVTGCSHTFGAESIQPGDCDNPNNPQHSWAQQLGEQLEIPLIVNLSECGNSNDKMFQDIIYEVSKTDYSQGRTRNVMCIVQYTHWDRMFIRNPVNAGQGFNLTAQVANTPHLYPDYVQAAVPSWVDHMAANANRHADWLYKTLALRMFLKQHNIDFAFWCAEPINIALLPDECLAFISNMPMILNFTENWYETMDRLGDRQPKGHWRKETMALWLPRITNFLNGHYDFNTISAG